MSETGNTLYDRIGGEAAVSRLIDRFYERVLADPELAPFFASTSMDTLRRMQREFLGKALDGPQVYTGLSLAQAHSGRGITLHHFSRFAQHMVDTLRELGLSETDVNDVIERINMYADDITGETSPSG